MKKAHKEKPRLLIVDDEKEICEFIGEIFKDKAILTYYASSGRKALKILKEVKPQIALIDLYLSRGMNGLEVAGALKDIVPQCVPIIITWDVSKLYEKNQRRSTFYYLSKPFTVKKLEKVVMGLLRRKGFCG